MVSLNDLATDICLWAEKRAMILVPHYLPGLLSRRGQILRTEWSLNHSRQDSVPGSDHSWICLPWGEHETGNVHLSCSGGDGVESGQSCPDLDGLYAYAYPPTSLIRACLNKNKKRRDLPNRARLAKPVMVPGPLDLAITFH